jgi:hypothetical protein
VISIASVVQFKGLGLLIFGDMQVKFRGKKEQAFRKAEKRRAAKTQGMIQMNFKKIATLVFLSLLLIT